MTLLLLLVQLLQLLLLSPVRGHRGVCNDAQCGVLLNHLTPRHDQQPLEGDAIDIVRGIVWSEILPVHCAVRGIRAGSPAMIDRQRSAQVIDETLEVDELQIEQVADARPRHVRWQRR